MTTDTNLKRAKCSELALKIKNEYNLKKTLYLNYLTSNLFEDFQNNSDLEIQFSESKKDNKNVLYGDPFVLLDQIKDKFDFVIGNLPFGLKREEWQDKEKDIYLRERKNWLILFKSLFNLSENGQGLFIVEPSILQSKDFIKQLNKKGFYVNAIFNCPEKMLSLKVQIFQPDCG
jgi:hypothetical protein